MKMSTRVSALVCAVSLLTLSGCVAAIGNRPPVQSNATIGQQLIDLQRARDSGAMSENEYQAQRSRVLGAE